MRVFDLSDQTSIHRVYTFDKALAKPQVLIDQE